MCALTVRIRSNFAWRAWRVIDIWHSRRTIYNKCLNNSYFLHIKSFLWSTKLQFSNKNSRRHEKCHLVHFKSWQFYQLINKRRTTTFALTFENPHLQPPKIILKLRFQISFILIWTFKYYRSLRITKCTKTNYFGPHESNNPLFLMIWNSFSGS